MQWWAHRGSGKGLLENTLKGFEIARAAGFKAVEFDVMLSADGVPMVHHDWRMGRCAQQPGSTHEPWFGALSAAQIAQYRVAGEPIPVLAEVVDFCLAQGLVANVELKATGPANARGLGQTVLTSLHGLNAHCLQTIRDTWVFSSFYHASLLPLQEFGLALLYETLPNDWTVHAHALRAKAIHLSQAGATPTAIRRVHTTGREVRVYTVNDIHEAKALQALGVNGLFTDQMEFNCFF